MGKVLFLNQPSFGHLNTLLSIATQMKEDGHSVRFLVPGLWKIKTYIQILDTARAIPEMIQKNGLDVDLMSPPLSLLWAAAFLPFKSGHEETMYAVGLMFKGIAHYARQILKFIARDRPDVMVTDFALPGTSLAAEIAGIPYVVIYHSGLPFRGDGIPPFGSGLPIGGDPDAAKEYALREDRTLQVLNGRFNGERRKLGLPPSAEDMVRRPYSPWLNLVTTVTAAEAPRTNITANTLFVGPCFGKRKAQADFPFAHLNADRFKVFVSLGTVFNNKPAVFRKIMDALDRPEYQLIISAGGAFDALQQGPIPKNTAIFRSVPQVELLQKIDLFVSHGGNNSINEALAAGKPIIVMPVGGEQGDNASRVLYLGAGRRLDIARFDAEQLRTAVDEIRTQPTFRERATMIMREIATTQGLVTASRCIDWVARHRAPLNRPDGHPLTITPSNLNPLLVN